MPYPGDSVTLTAEFLSAPGGPLVDASALSITITGPGGTVEVPTTTSGIVHVSTGLYRYTWVIPASADIGYHVVFWSGNSGAVTATDLISVAAAPAAWCTTDDVTTYTGITTTAGVVVQASAIIDIHIGRTYYELVTNPDGGQLKVGRRDHQWLRQACAYQAAWMRSQPDIFDRLDVTQVALDGRALTLRDPALTLAPLARKALKRVSWLRSRSLHIRTPFTDGVGPVSPSLTAEANDAYEGPWIPLGAG